MLISYLVSPALAPPFLLRGGGRGEKGRKLCFFTAIRLEFFLSYNYSLPRIDYVLYI